MSTSRTSKKAANTTIVMSADSPEAFRHATLWITVQKVTRSGPWTFVCAAHSEHSASVMFERLRDSDAHVALVPSEDSGGFLATSRYDDTTDEEMEPTFKARAPLEIEEWDDNRRVR